MGGRNKAASGDDSRSERLIPEGALAESHTADVDGRAGLAWRGVEVHADVYLEPAGSALGTRAALAKRCVDVVGATIALVLAVPLLAALAVIVKLDSPGPVLFVQTRVGLGGRRFRMLKLRTMREGAEHEVDDLAHLSTSDDRRLFKIPDDPRATRVGRTLRRWSLDELPQLYNVIAGHMSLVGPRPFFDTGLADYAAHHFCRLTVKPGITGLWQVSGRSDILDFEEVVRLDRQYIEHWSLALDLALLARTVPAVVGRRGAY